MGAEKRVVVRTVLRLDAERPDLDAVRGALFYRPAQLGETCIVKIIKT